MPDPQARPSAGTPGTSTIFLRKRLLKRLDEASRAGRAIWIQGPPGAGKTTVVSDYLGRRRGATVWLQTDAADADPATFFHFLSASVERNAAKGGPSLPRFTFEYHQSLDVFARRYFDQFWATAGPSPVLVLDNFQEIDASSPVHRVLSDAVTRAPVDARIIFISRTPPGPPYARASLHRLLQTVGDRELVLTEAEAWGIASLNGAGRRRHRAVVEQLRQRSQGWMAGFILMLEQSSEGASPASLDPANRELLFAYFAEEIFARADPATRDVLITTAVLPFMTRELACALSKNPRAGKVIEALYAQNYFVSLADSARGRYQFHPLFHEFLRAQLLKRGTGSERAALAQQAARLLESAGHPEEALELDIATENWQHAVRVLLTIAPAMAEQGRVTVLDQYIGRFPAQPGSPGAWLAYWTGVCRIGRDARESYRHFERAFLAFGASDLTGRVLAFCGAADSVLLQWDDFAALDPLIDWLNERSDRELESLPSTVYAKCAESMTSALMFRRIHQENFPEWLERALHSAEQLAGSGSRAALTFLGLSSFCVSTGNVREMKRVLKVLTAMSERDSTPLLQIARCYAEGASDSLIGEFGRAGEWMERGIDLSRHTGVSVWEHELFASATHIAMNRGDAAAAKRTFDRSMGHFAQQGVGSSAEHHFLLGWYDLLIGSVTSAVTHAQRAVEEISKSAAFPELICRYLLAEALFAARRREDARHEVETAQRLAAAWRLPHWTDSYLVLEASFALAEDDESTAARLLADALPRIRDRGCINRFGWVKRSMTRVCACALRHGIEVPFVQALIRQNPNAFELPPPDVTAWPWPVRVHALGRFVVMVDDTELRFATKAQKKPLELLKALMAFGSVDVQEDRLSDALWPDADADAAARSLTATIHRLRRLLGHDTLLRQNGCVSLNGARCWSDVAGLEQTMRDLDQCDDEGPATAAGALTRTVLRLYNGPFLGSHGDAPWVLAARDRLQRDVLRRFRRSARYLQSTNPVLAQQCEERAHDLEGELKSAVLLTRA